jgi:hypothetical protein
MAPCDKAQETARLAARARLAYEVGGLRLGLREAWPVVPLTVASLGCCGAGPFTLLCGVLLLMVSVGLVSMGGAAARAVRPGLLAGCLCAALPMAAQLLHLCTLVGRTSLVQFCLVGGLLSGGLLGYRTGRLAAGRPLFFAVAAAIAGVAGTLGCVVAGLAGTLGMVLGLLGASMPILLLARARS